MYIWARAMLFVSMMTTAMAQPLDTDLPGGNPLDCPTLKYGVSCQEEPDDPGGGTTFITVPVDKLMRQMEESLERIPDITDADRQRILERLGTELKNDLRQ